MDKRTANELEMIAACIKTGNNSMAAAVAKNMDAAAVTAYVNAKWPQAKRSPLAQAFDAIVTNMAADVERFELIADAKQHAKGCLSTAYGDRWALDDLAFNIESNFPDLDPEDCLTVAEWALNNGKY